MSFFDLKSSFLYIFYFENKLDVKLLKPESENFLGSFNNISFENLLNRIPNFVLNFYFSAGILHSTISGERSFTHRTSKYFFP